MALQLLWTYLILVHGQRNCTDHLVKMNVISGSSQHKHRDHKTAPACHGNNEEKGLLYSVLVSLGLNSSLIKMAPQKSMEETVTQLLIFALGTHSKINQSGTIASSLCNATALQVHAKMPLLSMAIINFIRLFRIPLVLREWYSRDLKKAKKLTYD